MILDPSVSKESVGRIRIQTRETKPENKRGGGRERERETTTTHWIMIASKRQRNGYLSELHEPIALSGIEKTVKCVAIPSTELFFPRR